MRQASAALILAACLAFGGATTALAQDSQAHLVVIVGAAGGDIYEEVFHNWAIELVDAATTQMGLAAEQITYLGANPELDPQRITAKSDRDNVQQTFRRLADTARPDDQIFVVLIGHGSGEGEQSKFNIPGRDLSAIEYDAMLDLFVSQQIAFVNTASASGDFAVVLTAPNRVIVTATRDAAQNNQTVFPRFFVQAFAGDGADLDKDGRVSLLEAYSYTSREVKRFYEDDGRMITESAMLEDNGDGEGSHEPDGAEGDGNLARRLFLDNPVNVAAAGDRPAADTPELRALFAEQRQLRERIDDLKLLKNTMDPELYDDELEKLLVALALKDQEIRAKGGSR